MKLGGWVPWLAAALALLLLLEQHTAAAAAPGQPAKHAKPASKVQWAQHINDLDTLLDKRAHERRISLVSFNLAFRGMLDNYLHALRKYGKVHNFLVAATTAGAAKHCADHGIPCWNATGSLLATAAVNDDEQLFQQGRFAAVTWAKVVVASQVISRGYDVHYGDVDTVYFRDVWQNFVGYAQKMHADGVAMAEYATWNSGNYFFFSNAYTVNFFTAWLAGLGNEQGLNDQLWLPKLGANYRKCCTPQECRQLAAQPGRNFAVVAAHVSQSVELPRLTSSACMTDQHCLPQPGTPLCGLAAIYQHAICLTGVQQKSAALQGLGLWFVHGRHQGARSMRQRQQQQQQQQAQKLPCKQQLVWEGLFANT